MSSFLYVRKPENPREAYHKLYLTCVFFLSEDGKLVIGVIPRAYHGDALLVMPKTNAGNLTCTFLLPNMKAKLIIVITKTLICADECKIRVFVFLCKRILGILVQ